MKKVSLVIIQFIFAFIIKAQQPETLPKVIDDTLFTSYGYKVVIGQDLKLGVGATNYGDFKFVTVSTSNFLTGGTTNQQQTLSRKWNGHLMKVKRFRKEGSAKRGYTYAIILGGGNIVNYECDIEAAIAAGEIIIPDEFMPKAKPAVVEVKSQLSISDELLKLKKLLDDGILTKEEFDAQKKKLLEKQ